MPREEEVVALWGPEPCGHAELGEQGSRRSPSEGREPQVGWGEFRDQQEASSGALGETEVGVSPAVRHALQCVHVCVYTCACIATVSVCLYACVCEPMWAGVCVCVWQVQQETTL